jgi:branched-chain amino acid transport system substrate-binding protein
VAIKELNDRGGLLGKQVEFVNLDGKSDPVTVGNVTVELIDNGADLIVAPCDFDFGGPASRAAQEAGLVGLSTCASDPLYSSWTLGDKQFTLSMWNTTMGAVAADFAVKERSWKTAYVVTDQFIAYTKSLSKYFVAQFQANGGEVILEDTYTFGDNDFSAQIARLQALGKKPDVIFVSSYGQDIGVIIRRFARSASTRRCSAATLMTTRQCTRPRRAIRQQHLLRHAYGDGAEAHPDMQKFIDLYTQMHGGPPDSSFVATGWDTVMMLAQAVEAAGSTDGAAVAKALEDGQFKLLTGDLDYRTAEEGHMPDKAAGDDRAEGRQAELPRLAAAGIRPGALMRTGRGSRPGSRRISRCPLDRSMSSRRPSCFQGCGRSTVCRCPLAPERSSGLSARTAPARRPLSMRSPARCRWLAAACCWTATRSQDCRRASSR